MLLGLGKSGQREKPRQREEMWEAPDGTERGRTGGEGVLPAWREKEPGLEGELWEWVDSQGEQWLWDKMATPHLGGGERPHQSSHRAAFVRVVQAAFSDRSDHTQPTAGCKLSRKPPLPGKAGDPGISPCSRHFLLK